MKRWKYMIGYLLIALACFPVAAVAASEQPQGGRSDVYIGVTTITKSNVTFLVVDEADVPIEGATIDIWADEILKYQLLGVTRSGGIYETSIPYGNYPYEVYKTGYEKTAQELVLPGKESPHIEKVILKKKLAKDNQPGGIKEAIKTGDSTKISIYILLAGIVMVLVIILFWKQRSAKDKR